MIPPRISHKPIFSVIFNTISNYWDIMNNFSITCFVTKYASCVVFESIWYSNTASDRSTLHNFLHHVLLTTYIPKLINTINEIFIRYGASFTWTTISAKFHWGALLSIVLTSSLINGACSISNFIISHPGESIICFTTMTTIVWFFTRNEWLRWNVDIWPKGFSCNFDPIRECWCSCVSPTRSTIGRNMLVEYIS